MVSKRNGTLYVGVTSDLVKRVWQHKAGATDGFTGEYSVQRLVWHELHEAMKIAILYEKQTKSGSRARKVALMEAINPPWLDLYERST